MLMAAKERMRPAADEATTLSIAPFEPVDTLLDDDELDATEELEEVEPQPFVEHVGSKRLSGPGPQHPTL